MINDAGVEELLRRAVNALEAIAIHQKRVADMLEAQARDHHDLKSMFGEVLGEAVGESMADSAPVPRASDEVMDNPSAKWDGNPHNWYIEDHDGPNPRIMLRLDDGSAREATPEERRRLQ